VKSEILIPTRILLAGEAADLARVLAIARGQGWNCQRADTLRDVLQRLRRHPTIDLVIVAAGEDLAAALELCRQIKLDERTRFVSVILLIGPEHARRRADAYEAGADDCLTAIAPEREIVIRILKAVRLKHATDSLEDSESIITALAKAIEGKDEYTCGHVDRVSAYCVEIGRRLQVGQEALAALKTGGVVHDIGKIGIPDHILNKPGKLSDGEMAVMRRHPLIGYDILKNLRTFGPVLPIVRWHHERPNGSGYPDGLEGEALPLLPRIAAVADVFDALSTARPYRGPFPLSQCLQIMRQSAAEGDLDGEVVQVLAQIIEEQSLAGLLAAAA